MQVSFNLSGKKHLFFFLLWTMKIDICHFTSLHFTSLHFTSPHLTSPHLTSPHLTSPHLTSPHLTSPHLTSPHLTSPHLTSPHLTSPLFTSFHLISSLHVTLISLHFTSPHFTSPHLISLHPTLASLYLISAHLISPRPDFTSLNFSLPHLHSRSTSSLHVTSLHLPSLQLTCAPSDKKSEHAIVCNGPAKCVSQWRNPFGACFAFLIYVLGASVLNNGSNKPKCIFAAFATLSPKAGPPGRRGTSPDVISFTPLRFWPFDFQCALCSYAHSFCGSGTRHL